MRELHVVAISEDGRHVELAARRGSAKGTFKLALDATLAAALRGDLPRPGAEEVPELSPKEIQARLRAGESVEQIARSAGVPQARVERYAGPVQGEMARMIDAARSAHVVRGRLGRSAVDLGTAVDAALTTAGAEEDSSWSTFRREDGQWLVTVRWYARKRSRSASWAYDPARRTVTAEDPASAALAHQESADAPVRRKPAPASAPAPATRTSSTSTGTSAGKPTRKATPKPAAKKAAKKAPTTPAKRAAATQAPAKKATAKQATATKATATKATATKAPARKATATKAAATPAKKAAKRAPAPPRTAAVRVPARKAPVRLRVVPDPEPAGSKPPRARARAAKQRASVPAWADVLLGTAPGGDR